MALPTILAHGKEVIPEAKAFRPQPRHSRPIADLETRYIRLTVADKLGVLTETTKVL